MEEDRDEEDQDKQDQDKALVLEAEQRRIEAVVAADMQGLDQLFADDLVHIHSTGLVHSKAQLLQHIDRKRGFLAIRRGLLRVRIEGNVAVMTGPITNLMRGAEGSEVIMRGFVTQILRRDSDGWKFTNFQLTVCTEP